MNQQAQPRRAPPDFIVIGAQKCGTTACARNLGLHPAIDVFQGTTEYGQMEIEFFNQHWDRGVDWYYSHFDGRKGLRGEKTAELFHRRICHVRMHQAAPQARLILLLRNPVQRAWSQWKMARHSKRDETRPFEEVIEEELGKLSDAAEWNAFDECEPSEVTSNWRQGYLRKGFYARQLRNLLSFYTRSSIHIAISERVKVNMPHEYGRMHKFLGVSDHAGAFATHYASRDSTSMPLRTALLLKEIYRESVHELESLLGFEIPEWHGKSSP